MLRPVAALLMLLSAPSGAGADGCRLERLPDALVRCLNAEADRQVAGIRVLTDQVMAGLQRASAAELRWIAAAWDRGHRSWVRRTASVCSDRHPSGDLAQAECRLAAARARRARVRDRLRVLARDFGGTTAPLDVPESVDLHVPLGRGHRRGRGRGRHGGAGGPGVVLDVPLYPE